MDRRPLVPTTRRRSSVLVASNLSTIPSSTLVTSSSSSSFILPPIDRSGALANPSDDPACPTNHILCFPSLPSLSSMRGLVLAETGDSIVELDIYAQPGGSGHPVGQRADQGDLTPTGSTLVGAGMHIWHKGTLGGRGTWRDATNRSRGDVQVSVGLPASDTLLQISASPCKSTSELRALLGNSAFRLKRNASIIPPALFHVSASVPSIIENDDLFPDTIALEKAKSRARVELDIVLESETCVQGSALKGTITIHVHEPVLLSKAKIRVVGYEAIPHGNTRCTFYQCAALLPHVAPTWDSVLASPPDGNGWAEAKEGIHILPFSLTLPADGTCGFAKGTLNIHSGVALRYFAMASIRLRDQETLLESVAHFYRSCEIWPRLSFTAKLAATPRPLVGEAARTVFRGGYGKVRLTAAMHRLYWVAGQRCVIHLKVVNDSKKTVKGASITLLRTTTVFKPLRGRKRNTNADPDACETMTMRKTVATSTLVMGQKCVTGHASAKGWWTGVRPGDTADFVHHIVLPSDALSVPRVRLLEVEYTLNVSVTTGGLSSDVQVTLPIRIINFISIDPPPTYAISQLHGRLRAKPQLGRSETWYRKSRSHEEVNQTVPGMKYSSTDMTVVAQEGELESSVTEKSVSSQAGVSTSGDSPSVYPPSESAGTITQRLNITASLDDIDLVIGSDSRIHNFVTEAGQLTGSGSLGSRLSLRGPRGPRLASLPEAITPTSPREDRTPQQFLPDYERAETSKEPVQPFLVRQPSITRASSMPMAKSDADGDLRRIKNRSRSEFH